jgi:hypothetical protein
VNVKTAFVSFLLLALTAVLPAQVVIDEIHYHPKSDLQEDEFIELHNAGAQAVSLEGWSFTDGVSFTFPAGTTMAPGAYLVVARDAARIRAVYGLSAAQVIGSYTGALSNGGEALELQDARGRTIDYVLYDDDFPWPEAADGGGPSIECVNVALDNATPRNWLASESRGWREVRIEGAATSNRLYLFLEGAGECLIDELSIVEVGTATNIFPAGDFEGGGAGWSFTGTHAGSSVAAGEAFAGSRALHIVATGPGATIDTSANRLIDGMVTGKRYLVRFWARALGGSSSLIHRYSGGGLIARTDLHRLEGTPGGPSSVRSDDLRPLIAAVAIEPRLPAPNQPVQLLAAIEDENLVEAKGTYDAGGGPVDVPLRDDGTSGDLLAGDGVYTGSIPGAPRGAIVDYSVAAADAGGSRVASPPRRYPVAEFNVSSNLPVYHIFIRKADWDRLNADVWTSEYFPAVFVHDGEVYDEVGLRFRGGRPRLFRKKSLKLEFSGPRGYEGREELNLNAAAMDDDYITEPLGHWFYERCGLEASEARFVRVELNGEFWGLFIDVEQVDERYLERHGLDPEGALYKAVGIVGSLRKLDGVTYEGQTYTYQSQYEKKTRKGEPYADLIELIHGLYDTPAAQMEAYLEQHVDVEQYINYLAISNLMCVWDNMQHNFYLHRDTLGSGKWRVIPWDLDHAWGEWEWSYYYDRTYPLLMGTRTQPFAGVWYTWNQLWTVLLAVPGYRDMYHARLRELLNTRFAEGPVFRKIDELVEAIRPTVALDEAKWPDALEPQHTGPKRTLAQEIPLLKQNFTRRRQWVAQQLGVQLETVPAVSPLRRGDVDGDAAVTIADAVKLLLYLFLGGNELDCEDAADADDDGALNVADAMSLLRHLFQGGAAPAAPGPGICGADPTADSIDCDYSGCS